MCALTPMFPSNQQEWYSTSTMEYPWLDSFSPTLPSSLYPSFDQLDEFKNYNINLLPHHMNLADINGTNNNSNNDQEEHQGSVLEKKLNHNASERDRRRKLNALYASLRALLPPSDQKRKLSIPKTVAGVVKYIPEQKQELQRLYRRKEELMKRISNKIETLNHQQEQLRNRALMMESIDSSSQKIAANWITNTEIAVQIATWKWTSISDMLLRLEENGLNVISVSSSVSSTARIFYTLHLQMRGDCRVRLEELDGMLYGLHQSL
ncbi:transcription factor bHLH101 [Brassica napus]|uniref:transcription factor bHLH101 n=1 Tax=Brassica napus TaxID=3708 RepID=UPI002078AF37|nr:transcription factor bHLH101 [Brassica napus]